MPKYGYLLVLFCLVTTTSFTQKNIGPETLVKFLQAPDDSIFLTQFSDDPYQLNVHDFSFNADTSIGSFANGLLHSTIGKLLGPYHTDSTLFYVKIISIDSAFKVRVGNIWLSVDSGRETALRNATEILAAIRNGQSFNTCCQLYSEDGNKMEDCDLGWFYNTTMVQPFADEITKHQMGDVYLVETKFGFHIVKSLANPYRARKSVTYVKLVGRKQPDQ